MRVLVVDDDPDFLLLTRRALEARGHEAESTSSAFGLVNKVAGVKPHVLVLDCEMPGLSGFSIIELLAKDRRTANVPVLLVSAGYGDAQLAAAAAHPFARFKRKDGHMRALVDDIEAQARVVELATVKG